MQEVPDEVQAAMAVKLADDVRNLIREEVKVAFRDYNFLYSLDGYMLLTMLMSGANSNTAFRQSVVHAISKKLDNGY